MGPVEVLWDGDGVPLPGGEQSENITFRHPSDVGGKKGFEKFFGICNRLQRVPQQKFLFVTLHSVLIFRST